METSLLVGMKATRQCLARATGCEEGSNLLSSSLFPPPSDFQLYYFLFFTHEVEFLRQKYKRKKRKRLKNCPIIYLFV